MECKTAKIMPSSEEQGEFVLINESDFDESIHTLFGEEKTEKTLSKAELQAALDEKKIAYKPANSKAELQALLDSAQ